MALWDPFGAAPSDAFSVLDFGGTTFAVGASLGAGGSA